MDAGAALDGEGEPEALDAAAWEGAGEPEPWKSFWKSMDLEEAAPLAGAASGFPPAKPMVVFLD